MVLTHFSYNGPFMEIAVINVSRPRERLIYSSLAIWHIRYASNTDGQHGPILTVRRALAGVLALMRESCRLGLPF
jgi:hypothetical protein